MSTAVGGDQRQGSDAAAASPSAAHALLGEADDQRRPPPNRQTRARLRRLPDPPVDQFQMATREHTEGRARYVAKQARYAPARLSSGSSRMQLHQFSQQLSTMPIAVAIDSTAIATAKRRKGRRRGKRLLQPKGSLHTSPNAGRLMTARPAAHQAEDDGNELKPSGVFGEVGEGRPARRRRPRAQVRYAGQQGRCARWPGWCEDQDRCRPRRPIVAALRRLIAPTLLRPDSDRSGRFGLPWSPNLRNRKLARSPCGVPVTTFADDPQATRLLTELEPVVTRELERHITQARNWYPHEYVPWSEGRTFDGVLEGGEPWDAEPGALFRVGSRRADRQPAH